MHNNRQMQLKTVQPSTARCAIVLYVHVFHFSGQELLPSQTRNMHVTIGRNSVNRSNRAQFSLSLLIPLQCNHFQ